MSKGIRLRVATLILDEESIDEFEYIAERVLEAGAVLITPGSVVDFGRGSTVSNINEAMARFVSKKYGVKLGWEPTKSQY